jgi:hypothetical protein
MELPPNLRAVPEISTAPHLPRLLVVGSQLPILTRVDQSYLHNPDQ